MAQAPLDADELAALEGALLAAATTGDQQQQLQLYRRACEYHLALEDIDQACFFATNAWVIALSLGDASERELHKLLASHGRVPAAQ